MKTFRNMTAVEKSAYLNGKFFEVDGKLYHRELDHHNKGYGAVGSESGNGYLRVRIEGHLELAHRIVYAMNHGYWPENSIDHIDRDRQNNHINNLREESNQCQMRNAGTLSSNKSGVKGVSWDKLRNKWIAQIMVYGKHTNLGYYFDKVDAACARLAAEQCLDWPDCDSNSTAYQYVQKHILKK